MSSVANSHFAFSRYLLQSTVFFGDSEDTSSLTVALKIEILALVSCTMVKFVADLDPLLTGDHLGRQHAKTFRRFRCEEKILVDVVVAKVFAAQPYYAIDELQTADSAIDRVGIVGETAKTK